MRAPTRLLAAAAIAVAAVTTVTVPADAATTVKHFSSCAAVHKIYSGGIAKKGVTKNTVHSHGKVTHRKLKGSVKHSTALYKANKKLDRDKDGVACEKS
jgi:cytochrome c2